MAGCFRRLTHDHAGQDDPEPQRDDEQDEQDAEDAALVALGQLPAALERRQHARLLDDGDGHGDVQHAVDDDAGHDEQEQAAEEAQGDENPHAERRQHPLQADAQALAHARVLTAKLLHHAVHERPGDEDVDREPGDPQDVAVALERLEVEVLRVQHHQRVDDDGRGYEQGDEHERDEVLDPDPEAPLEHLADAERVHASMLSEMSAERKWKRPGPVEPGRLSPVVSRTRRPADSRPRLPW